MRGLRIVSALYRVLLFAYPRALRDRKGDDMADCFDDLVTRAHDERGPVGVAGVALRTLADLPVSAWRAHRSLRSARRGGTGMESWWQDTRFAVRGLRRNPGFAALAVLSLGLGVGANTTMFSMATAVVWSELPAERPDELVRLFEVRDGHGSLSYLNFVDVMGAADVFTGGFLHRLETFGLRDGDASQVVHGEVATAEYFDVLEVAAALGRVFDPEIDGAPESPLVAVLSHDLWVGAFASDPGVVGRTIQLNGHPTVVVGVAPQGFTGTKFGLSMDLWVPIRSWAFHEGWSPMFEQSRGNTSYLAVARLAPGVDRDQANVALETISGRLREAYPRALAGTTFRALPEAAGAIAPQAAGMPELIGLIAVLGSGLVLLVACGNVASLLLARAVVRRPEIGVRLALGAGRGRLVRQLLTESLLLALLGAAAGVALAEVASHFTSRFLPALPYRFALDTSPDGRALLFATGGALLAVLVFGLAPALQATRRGVAGVGSSGARAGFGLDRSRLLNGVVVSMVALSFVTLFLAGTFTASLEQVRRIPAGFAQEERLLASVDLSLGGHGSADAPRVLEEMLTAFRRVPGVTDATVGSAVPMGDWRSTSRVWADDRAYGPDELGPVAWRAAVAPGYFRVAGVRLLAGRAFAQSDDADAPPVVIVNEALATTFWPNGDAVGQRLRYAAQPGGFTMEIVGVAATGRYDALTEDPNPAFYLPLEQASRVSNVFVIRTQGDPAALAAAVRDAARSVDPAVPLFDVRTAAAHAENAAWLHRMGAELAIAIGLLAAALAAGGLYGIMVFRVRQRRRELGIRIALGAGSGSVARHVLAGSLRLVLVGVAAGGAAALLAGRGVSSIVYGVDASSPARIASVAGALTALALAATWVPAWSATRSDPVEAMRTE